MIIFWDFDGVLMDSNALRDRGFEEVLADYPPDQVAALLDFHRANGGLSRYVKFRYFIEEIRGENLSQEMLDNLTSRFSAVMRTLLVDPDLLISETIEVVKQYHQSVPMHIVSGSDQEELRYLCRSLHIADYFRSIHGSPTPKTEWVARLMSQHGYPAEDCVLIGDSVNDYEAAIENEISFVAYNNPDLLSMATKTMKEFVQQLIK